MKNNNKYNFNEIKILIAQEEEEAIRIFRKSNFDSGLRKRMQIEEKKAASSLIWLKKPVVILGMVLLAVCAGVIALIVIFSSSPQSGGLYSIEQFFQDAPGIQRLVKNQRSRDIGLKDKSSTSHILEKEIKNVFSSIDRAKYSGKDEITFLWMKKKPPRLDLNKKIEILIKEKKLHLFLSKYLIKSEEEENDPKDISFHFSLSLYHESLCG